MFHVRSHEFRPRLVVTYVCYALCCRDVHFCGVVRVVDAVFARLFVCVFVCYFVVVLFLVRSVLFCCIVLVWVVLGFGSRCVVLLLFWVVLCCLLVGLLVCLLAGWSIGWLVVLCCFICVCVVLLFSLLVDLVGHVIMVCSSVWVWCCFVWLICVLHKSMRQRARSC